MSDTVELRLEPSWLPTLGSHLGPLGKLSPLGVGDVDPAAWGALVQHGIVDGEGNIHAEYRPVLERLARATRLSRVRFMSGLNFLEYQAFFAEDGEAPVAMTTAEGELLVRWPVAPEEVMSLAMEYAGISDETDLPFVAEVTVPEARVGMALVDATRQHLVIQLALEQEATRVSVPLESLVPRLSEQASHPNRMETTLRELQIAGDTMTPEQVRSAMAGLLRQGLVEDAGGGAWVAAGALEALAAGALHLHGIYRFDIAAESPKGALVVARSVVVQTGMRSLLLMEHNSGMVRFGGVSGEQFVSMLAPLFGAEPLDFSEEFAAAEAALAPPAPPAPPEPEPAPAMGGGRTLPYLGVAGPFAADLAERTPAAAPPPTPPPPSAPPAAAPPPSPGAVPGPPPPQAAPPQAAPVPAAPVPSAPPPPPPPPPPAAPEPPEVPETVFCGQCGTPIPADSTFCGVCGARQER